MESITRRQFIGRLLGAIVVAGAVSTGRLVNAQAERQRTSPKSFTIPDPKTGETHTLFQTDEALTIVKTVSNGSVPTQWVIGYQQKGFKPVEVAEFSTEKPISLATIHIPAHVRVFALVKSVHEPKDIGELSATLTFSG